VLVRGGFFLLVLVKFSPDWRLSRFYNEICTMQTRKAVDLEA
jgi:hypothetical protein